MDNLGSRIKLLRKELGLTQQGFAEVINLKRNTVATYEIGATVPSDRTILDICREFQVSETWLRTGEGEMRRPMSVEENLAVMFGDILAGAESAKQRFIRAVALLPDETVSAVVDAIIKLAESMQDAEKKE